jgi:iron complex transport system ATP-binding protein
VADERIALEKLADLGIADLAEADFTRISGGQRQLALIARALAQETPILVLDEPTASLDFGNQMLVLSHVRALAAQGYGVVLSTHDPDHALLIASRVAIIADGGLRAVGPPADVVTAETLSAIYRTDVRIEETASGRRVCVPGWGG